MMLALEGADRSGKTTLWEALKLHLPDARFVPRLPLSTELLRVLRAVEDRTTALWEAVYDPSTLYVCDRSFTVSGPVYDRLYGREARELSDLWVERTRVVYVEVPLSELRRRYNATGDDLFDAANYGRVLSIYEEVLPRYTVLRVDGRASPDDNARRVRDWTRSNFAASGAA